MSIILKDGKKEREIEREKEKEREKEREKKKEIIIPLSQNLNILLY